MTEWEKGSYANGARRFEKNVRFATVDTVKAGWLLKNKGTWLVTDTGKAAFKKFQRPGGLLPGSCPPLSRLEEVPP